MTNPSTYIENAPSRRSSGPRVPHAGLLFDEMMDALLPAVDVIRQAADAGKSIKETLHKAAEAAENGAVSTKEFQARFGRAKNLGERTIGHQDPGATSMALIFQGFFEALS